MSRALISGQAGVAAWIDGDMVRSYHLDGPSNVDRTRGEIPRLFGDCTDVIAVEGIAIEGVPARLELQWKKHRCLTLCLLFLDIETRHESRKLAMRGTEQLIAEREVDMFLRHRLFVAPMPGDVDIESMIDLANDGRATRVAIMLEEVFLQQKEIWQCRTAWDSVPIKLFGDEARKEQAAFELVEAGAFHMAAMASSAERNRTFPMQVSETRNSVLVDVVVRPQFNGCREGLFAWLELMARLDFAGEIESLVLPQLQIIGDHTVANIWSIPAAKRSA